MTYAEAFAYAGFPLNGMALYYVVGVFIGVKDDDCYPFTDNGWEYDPFALGIDKSDEISEYQIHDSMPLPVQVTESFLEGPGRTSSNLARPTGLGLLAPSARHPNPSAFPCPAVYASDDMTTLEYGASGMTLLDWFAGQAMIGILAAPWHPDMGHGPIQSRNYASVAGEAYGLAEAMLAEREARS